MRVLVVDDEAAIRFALTELLEAESHDVVVAEHAPAALALLEAEPADLILSDLRMPAMDGLQLLAEVRSRHPEALFVLMTAHGDERVAVGALREGAFDYLPKPFDNDEVRATVSRAREVLALRAENARLREELSGRLGPMIGESEPIREVFRTIRLAAAGDATVLILGESGTGKELAARALHELGPRRNAPFVAINCSALPADLIESELFGHAKGAFTGADRDRTGVMEAAHGGTLLLDEVGDLSLPAQAKLLRAIESRTVTRVGETRERAVDIRLIAATNQPLEALVAEGGFREDLLYRLRVIPIVLPPLRERRSDIPAIAVHLLAELSERHGRVIRTIAEDARRVLLAHDWPGNVRELRNVLERAVVLSEGEELRAADLPADVTGGSTVSPVAAAIAELPFQEARERALESFDRAFLTAALERHGGNISRTARALGVHRQSLQKMLRRLES